MDNFACCLSLVALKLLACGSSPAAAPALGSTQPRASEAQPREDDRSPCRQDGVTEALESESSAVSPNSNHAAFPLAGRLPDAWFLTPIRAHFRCFQRCYERGLHTTPELQGRVLLKLKIHATTGEVMTAEIATSPDTLPNAEVIDCVALEAKAIRFKGGWPDHVTVQYPSRFVPAQE